MCIKDLQIGARTRVVVRTIAPTAGVNSALLAADEARIFFSLALGHSANNVFIGPDGVTLSNTVGIRLAPNLDPYHYFDLKTWGDVIQKSWTIRPFTADQSIVVMEGILIPDVLDVPWSEIV